MTSSDDLRLNEIIRYGENILRHVLHRSKEDISKWRHKYFALGTSTPFLGHLSSSEYVLHEVIPPRLWTAGDFLHRITLKNRIQFALANEDFSKDSADFSGARERLRRVLADYGESLPA
jgi:hypothetical protein